MNKLTLVDVHYHIIEIEGMTFLIPMRLRKFERPIETNLRAAVALLKEKGWYEYVLMADMITTIVPSPRHGTWGILHVTHLTQPVFYYDSGTVSRSSSTTWLASAFVHEATHIFQRNYFSAEELKDKRKKERDACREQILFLKSCKDVESIKHLRLQLKQHRGWWEHMDSAPINTREEYNKKRQLYFRKYFVELFPHISL